VRVLAVLEQAPRSESRLTLAEALDPLGQPRLRVEWRLGDEEHRSLRTLVATLDDELRRTRSGRLDAAEWIESPSWQDAVFDVFHPAGTTRMGHDGVVDGDCRLHGAPGIAVCSASVFPTSGCVNPTLTIVALALRQAARLRNA
jgi:choline dehydrogenase-like flavoprotein